MHLSITVKYADGREAVGTVGPAEFVEFERHFSTPEKRVSVMEMSANPSMEWIFFLGWLAAKRLHAKGEHPGAIKPTFDGFLASIDTVDLMDEDEDEGAAVPLDGTAS